MPRSIAIFRASLSTNAWRLLSVGLLSATCSACSGDDTTPVKNGVPAPEGGTDGSSTIPDAGTPAADVSTSNPAVDSGAPPTGDGGAAEASLVAEGGLDASTEAGTPEASTSGDAAAPTGPCANLPGTVVYIESGDTQQNLLKNLGRKLRDSANITLAYNLTGSCTLINDIYANGKVLPNGTLKYVPSTAEDAAWTPSKPEATCTTGAEGVSIDVAISALFVESCGLGAPPAGSGLGLIQGPVQAYTFVVPTASTQTSIGAEEAYYAFGFGNANPLAPAYNPWNNEQFMFIRPSTKSTLVATAKNIALAPNKWKGIPENASSEVVNAVKSSTTPEATIGILGAEVYDSNRSAGIKTLAFKAFGQNAAYYPDSTSTAFDKQNLRDGHYTLWSPTVYIAKVDAANTPTNAAVHTVTDLVLGNSIAAGGAGASIDGLADVVKVGLVPECAMQVTRSTDGGNLAPYSPPSPCTCYYLSKISGAAGVPAGCTTCTRTADCGEGGAVCSHGYCESAPVRLNDAGAACFAGTPATHSEVVNACTSAQSIVKNVTLPNDGGLLPLP